MKASFAKMRTNYCAKMREQARWGDGNGDFVPVHGHGIGPVSGIGRDFSHREAHKESAVHGTMFGHCAGN